MTIAVSVSLSMFTVRRGPQAMVISVAKGNNAIRGHRQANPKGGHEVSRSCVAALDKGITLTIALRLAAKQLVIAEAAIVTGHRTQARGIAV